MPRYGQFLYGDELYGATPDTDAMLWAFQVAWDGSYTGAWSSGTFNNEALRMVDLTVTRGRDYMLRADGRGFEPFPPGVAVGIFDNWDGRYDPWNTSSPLYPNVKPGKFCKILSTDGAGGTTRPIMYGIIDDIQPVMRGRAPFARIVIHDGLQWLMDKTILIGLQSNIDKWDAVKRVRTAAGMLSLPWTWISYVYPSLTEEYPYWWAWQQNAWEAIQQINIAEGSHLIHSAGGNIKWLPRELTYPATTNLDQSEVLADIAIQQPWEHIRNEVRVVSYPLLYDTVNTTLWELQDTPAIANGEAFSVDARFRYSTWQPCGASITFNHTVNTAADGSGTNMTASCPLTYNTDIGEGAQITVTNNYGSAGYITLLRAVGDAIYPPYVATRKASDATSEAAYGYRSLELDSRWAGDTVLAQEMADWLLAELKDPIPQPVVQIENRHSLQFGYDVYDRVVFTAAKLGISSQNYRIGKIEHRWLEENGQAVRTLWKLEPYLTPFA